MDRGSTILFVRNLQIGRTALGLRARRRRVARWRPGLVMLLFTLFADQPLIAGWNGFAWLWSVRRRCAVILVDDRGPRISVAGRCRAPFRPGGGCSTGARSSSSIFVH
jgi:hypothetical protein